MSIPRRDPRPFQIAALALLVGMGVWRLGFELRLPIVAAIAVTALVTQWLCCRYWARIPFEYKSALISALSLTLLLRTESVLLAGAAGFLAIASKFFIRVGGKHLFNPANFALVACTVPFAGAWISPGQWGSAALYLVVIAGVGLLVLNRVGRYDVTLAFLATYIGGLFARALWLGDPLTIPWHQMQSGALLIFAFFMISDPKTTPDSRKARIAFGAVVAALALIFQFVFYEPLGLIYALVLCAPAVPLLDRLLPALRYRWSSRAAAFPISIKGDLS